MNRFRERERERELYCKPLELKTKVIHRHFAIFNRRNQGINYEETKITFVNDLIQWTFNFS